MRTFKLPILLIVVSYLFLIFVFLPPLFASAESIVPCGGSGTVSGGASSRPCTFNDFVEMGNRILRFLVFTAAPLIATILVIWAGILLVTSRGNSGKMEDAKGFIWKVLIGFIVAGGSFLIIKLILVTLGASSTVSSFLG